MVGPSVVSRHRVIALVAAGVLAGGAGGVVISQLGVAGATSPSPSPVAPFGAPGPDGADGMRGLGLLGGIAGGGRLLHGEATVAKAGGGTTVVRFQNGVISAISGSTMTVRSTDGFTGTYTVNGTSRISLNGTNGTLSKLAKNDQVRVLAVQSGSSDVAKMVFDGVPPREMFGLMHRGFGFGRMLRHRQGAPAAPGTSSGTNG